MPDYYNSAYTGQQIDSAVGAVTTKESTWDGKVNKSGDTMSGNLTINAELTVNKINEGQFHWVVSNGYLILQHD